MKAEYFNLIGSGGTTLPAVIWLPEHCKAILQVTHGMTEHMGRYEDFAEKLTAHGIAVAGFDLRGHGKNHGNTAVASCGQGGWQASLEDMHLFRQQLQQKLPGIPHFLLGFSLGSFLLREYLGKYTDNSLSGAIIMGTGHQSGWLLSIMLSIVNSQIRKVGYDNTSDLIRKLSFGTYNQKFKPNRSNADWLCANVEALDSYLADPLVRKDISSGLFWELLASMKRSGDPAVYKHWNHQLPLLLLSGQDDPVGNGGKGVQAVYQQMQKADLQKASMKLIPTARHDLLHEANAAASVTFILDWIESNV